MGTVIRPEISYKNQYWISRHRYYELKHFCLQYPEWKKEYSSINGFASKSSTEGEHVDGGSVGDPTAIYAEARIYYADRMQLVESAARKACAELYRFLMRCVTEGVSYECMRAQEPIPCGKDAFYAAYRRFFWILDKTRK